MVEEPPNMLMSLTKNFMNDIGIRPPQPQLDSTRLCNFYPMLEPGFITKGYCGKDNGGGQGVRHYEKDSTIKYAYDEDLPESSRMSFVPSDIPYDTDSRDSTLILLHLSIAVTLFLYCALKSMDTTHFNERDIVKHSLKSTSSMSVWNNWDYFLNKYNIMCLVSVIGVTCPFLDQLVMCLDDEHGRSASFLEQIIVHLLVHTLTLNADVLFDPFTIV
ncbi:hypothetical protein ACFE04_003309 [Oxalis oulophora]